MNGCSLSLLAALTLGRSADDRFPLVTDRVQSRVDNGLYAGCSVWIAQGDKVLYEKSFGAHTADTEVYIASAGKWLASATILAVTDEGKLSLDNPAVNWLPEFGTDPKGMATRRQLFSHSSGYMAGDFIALHPDRVIADFIASAGCLLNSQKTSW